MFHVEQTTLRECQPEYSARLSQGSEWVTSIPSLGMRKCLRHPPDQAKERAFRRQDVLSTTRADPRDVRQPELLPGRRPVPRLEPPPCGRGKRLHDQDLAP